MALILRKNGHEVPPKTGTPPHNLKKALGTAWGPQTSEQLSLSDRLVGWLGSLTVTQGRHAGKPFQVLGWQRQFIEGTFRDGITESGLSVARGNGKSTLVAGIALASVVDDGPLLEPNAQVLIAAASYDQGSIIFDHLLAFGEDELRDRTKYRVLNNTQNRQIINKATGSSVRVLSSDFKKAHGIAPKTVLADEGAQWGPGGDAMFAALKTSLGKVPGSRLICLGTRPRSNLHWFAKMLSTPATHRYAQIHAADNLDDFTNPAQWARANPSLLHLPDLREVIRNEAKDAESDPGLKASFLALRLNGGTSEVDNQDMLIDPGLWKTLLTQPDAPPEGRKTWGVDLGGSAAMSAIACCWSSGRLEALAMFGSEPSIDVRGVRDAAGSLYDGAVLSGDLIISGKRIPNIQQLFEEAEHRFGGRPDKIIVDRWRLAELKDALDDPSWQRVPLVVRGQGFRDGSEDVRAWRRACVGRKVNPVQPSMLLTAALAEATTISDPAGNEKLAKDSEGGGRKNSRDDLAAAAILAVAHSDLDREQAPTTFSFAVI